MEHFKGESQVLVNQCHPLQPISLELVEDQEVWRGKLAQGENLIFFHLGFSHKCQLYLLFYQIILKDIDLFLIDLALHSTSTGEGCCSIAIQPAFLAMGQR